ncbi:energy transducer TonB [uncultured Psychrobacter sp.]|uniref:energy transducer TonB n=1 Tax=uncultured Psychrobacter sp. TaxID=259303 RepID=UPI003457F9F0
MASTTIGKPSLKLTSMAIGIVVILHVLTAIGLIMVKPPTPITESFQATAPLEIEMVTLNNQAETVAAAEKTLESEAEPEPEVQPEPELEPVIEPEPEPVVETEPVVEPMLEPIVELDHEPKIVETPAPVSESVISTTVQTNADRASSATKPIYDTTYTPTTSEPRVNSTTADDQRRMQAEQQKAAAQNRARKQAQEAREAKAAADAKAAREAAEQAAQQAAAAQAASNEPVKFNESDARWAAAPSLSFPSRAERGARPGDSFTVLLTLRVNKQGGVDNVSLAQSSGNRVLDQEAQRQVRTGRFVPFMKDGVAVVGNVTLPITYQVPR